MNTYTAEATIQTEKKPVEIKYRVMAESKEEAYEFIKKDIKAAESDFYISLKRHENVEKE